MVKQYTLSYADEGERHYLVKYDITTSGNADISFETTTDKVVAGSKRVMEYIQEDIDERLDVKSEIQELIEVDKNNKVYIVELSGQGLKKVLSSSDYSGQAQLTFSRKVEEMKFYSNEEEAKEIADYLKNEHKLSVAVVGVSPELISSWGEEYGRA